MMRGSIWKAADSKKVVSDVGSPGKTRTSNLVVNSHPLCRLSYRGIWLNAARLRPAGKVLK